MAAWMRAEKEKHQTGEREEEEEEKEEEEEEDEEEDEDGAGGLWEYDSTWEEEEEEEEEGRREKKTREPASQEDSKAREKHSSWPSSSWWASASQEWQRPGRSTGGVKKCKSINRRNWVAARDMQKYRRHYPGLEESEVTEEDMWNLSFYKNEINFLPRGLYIEDLLETWQDNYSVLEENHSYIQWLFPLREQGMNFHAKRLTHQEIEAFKKSKEVMERFIRAYKLMLKFYGIELINEETGELTKAENWCERFWNLNRYSHNNLRITRILKCLGEMGYEDYQVQLVKFFLAETLVHQGLPRVLRSVLDYFMFTVRSKPKRRELVYFAWQHFKPKREFVWGPRKKLRRFRPLSLKLLTNPEEQAHAKEGEGEVVEKDSVESPKTTLQRLAEKPVQEEAGETQEKEKCGLSAESCMACSDLNTTVQHNHTEQPVSSISATLSLSDSNSVQDKGIRRRTNSVEDGELLQDGEVVEPLMKPVDDCKTSKNANQSQLALVTLAKEEKEDRKEVLVPSNCPLERQGHADECVGEAEGDNLKESKKRKLELSRLSGEIPTALKSPNDIERISHNLGEVVITKEEVSILAPKGGHEDFPDGKEIESLDMVIKRRKVDVVPKGGPSEADCEVIPPDDQGESCGTQDDKEKDLVCQEETKMAANPSADTLTGHKAGSGDALVDSNKNVLPGDGSMVEKVNEQEATTTPTESEAPWLSEPITPHERGVTNNAGWKEQEFKETSDGSLESNEISKLKEYENTTAGPEEE
ncbi:opioid growth factor receptor isoform X2 [Pseudonaja textilis]|uniref:opioid growth factor receptor isoform X2 n=1 Tax=Pseudonaja textilis TaxID=8673 RepID=UPI000EA85970|nr:opioid growth factor receptor isoform X2 [Pseudonaja textilis]